MKLFSVLLLVSLTPLLMQSQTYEIGGYFGGANFIGDVGSTTYIAPNTPAYGALFKWNRTSRHSFRGSIIFAAIEGDDSKSHESRRNERGYKFENSITEVSLGLEYTFWEFDVHSGRTVSAPYLYTGLTYFWYNALYKPGNSSEIKDFDGASAFAIPMVLGYKVTLGTKFVLAGEIGVRYTFTDGLDGSNPVKGLEDNENIKFGNLNNNDWYMFTGLTLSFTFGRKPCYCDF